MRSGGARVGRRDRDLLERSSAVVELLVLAALGFAALVVLGVLASVASMVWWMIALPFTLLRWTFKLLAALFVLPFILLFGLLGVAVFGAGALVFFVLPALPFIAIVWVIWALMKRRHPAPVTG
jgi:hypothetical protein